ncbi:MAG TPA: GtrA family protein [Caulobacteraceae bacterium]|nr:GtrA family protein [Caulobacteraceae bacterium]
MRLSSEVIGKFGRYLLTGGAAAAVDLTIFTSLHRLGVPAVAATTCSFLVAAAVNYSLCSIFVFRKPASARGFFIFVSGAALGYCINSGITLAGMSLTHFPPELCKVAGIGTAFLFNFYVNLTVVFRDRSAATASQQTSA